MKTTALKAFTAAVIIIFASAMFPVSYGAESYSNYEKALDLKVLGLLANTPEGFDLGRAPTRLEGAVMLVRLLGRENQARQKNYSHPFTDVPQWASAYVGYLYQNGLTKGIGDSRFGSNDLLSANQYITLVLRSLGYDDKTDFKYSQALEMARQTGLVSLSEETAFKNTPAFNRNDMTGISYNALEVKLKSSQLSLLDKLVNSEKVIYKPAAMLLGLYTSDLRPDFGGISSFKPVDTQYGSVSKTREDLFYLLRDTLYNTRATLKIDIRNYKGNIEEDFKNSFDKASRIVAQITGVEDLVSSWKYLYNSQSFTLTVEYRYSSSEYAKRREEAKATVNKARFVVASQIKPGMSDYDKEKVLHDYIINNTKYDYGSYLKGKIPDYCYNAYGCLVRGISVCEGYAQAMKLLSDLASIECMIVSGETKNTGSWETHAWNIVKIDGLYYHVDVTSDDPVSNNGTNILAYYYFNLPDSDMALTNKWDRLKYPVCSSTKSNYYYKNNMVAGSRDVFDKAVKSALEKRRTTIELKVSDYSKAKYSNLSDIIFKTNMVAGYKSMINEELGVIRIFNIRYS